ncbi:hypothetical protein BH09MYX1_BH09MYX1_15970 [soil metagenome]
MENTRTSRIALTVWLPAVIGLGAYLLAGHFALPPVASDAKMRAAVTQSAHAEHGPVVLHFLYGDCRCSAAVLAHLVVRGPRAGHDERIFLIDGSVSDLTRARSAGFTAEIVTAADVQDKYGVEGAPLLVIADRASTIVYEGGYTTTKQSPAIRDEAILARVEQGETVEALPIFGCAVSDRLKQGRDPLALGR